MELRTLLTVIGTVGYLLGSAMVWDPWSTWLHPTEARLDPEWLQSSAVLADQPPLAWSWWQSALDASAERLTVFVSLCVPPVVVGWGVRTTLRPSERAVHVACAVAVSLLVLWSVCMTSVYTAGVPRPYWPRLCAARPLGNGTAHAFPVPAQDWRWECPPALDAGLVRDAQLGWMSVEGALATAAAWILWWAAGLSLEDGWGALAAASILQEPMSGLRTTTVHRTVLPPASGRWARTWHTAVHRVSRCGGLALPAAWCLYGVAHAWVASRRSTAAAGVGALVGTVWAAGTIGWWIPAVFQYEGEDAYARGDMYHSMVSHLLFPSASGARSPSPSASHASHLNERKGGDVGSG